MHRDTFNENKTNGSLVTTLKRRSGIIERPMTVGRRVLRDMYAKLKGLSVKQSRGKMGHAMLQVH